MGMGASTKKAIEIAERDVDTAQRIVRQHRDDLARSEAALKVAEEHLQALKSNGCKR